MELTPQQKEAIEHEDGGLQLIACAGAGKTGVISQRIARLIKKGVEPKNIVAFTFTDKAAEEMKARIRLFLEKECPEKTDFGDMYIGTIHSFCLSILKELEPKYKSYEALTEAQRIAFVSKPMTYYSELGLVKLEARDHIKKYSVINKFLESADIMRDENINPDKLTDKDFGSIFKRYINLLDKNQYLDFGEMIFRLVKILETDKEVLKQLHEKVKHLVVDEYQDVNKIQEKLIEFISEGCKSVCIVGDDDQCVFQWRGSDPSYILNFEKNYSKYFKIRRISLETNFRSTEGIVNLSKEFIKKNKI
ncbi:MAG: ATP-dependent helicase, partial [Candidatus Pacearchaeota archaeon]|nr:ATP-dependent helicase [Candidatus Pacearchaeota archaeon]